MTAANSVSSTYFSFIFVDRQQNKQSGVGEKGWKEGRKGGREGNQPHTHNKNQWVRQAPTKENQVDVAIAIAMEIAIGIGIGIEMVQVLDSKFAPI